jgi:putative ABC transport system permease protein
MGGVAGIVLALAGNLILVRFTDSRALLTWHVVTAGIVFSAIVGLAAGMHPARKAAAMVPVDALRS